MKNFKTIGCAIILLFNLFISGCTPMVYHLKNTDTRIVTDDMGTNVAVPVHPQRIITLTSAFDTVVVDLVGPSRMAAISSLTQYEGFSTSWKEARQVNVFFKDYNLETIIAQHPDLVIVPDYSSSNVIECLRGMGIPTVVLKTGNTVKSAAITINRLADMVNEQDRGAFLTAEVQRDLEEVAKKRAFIPKAREKSVLFLSTMDGYAGKNSLFDDMCQYMGMINSPSAMDYPERTSFTDERIGAMNPDYLLIATYQKAEIKRVESFYNDPAFRGLTAVKERHVVPLKAAYLYTTNQYIGKSMLAIMKVVYPELFTEDRKSNINGGENDSERE